VEQWLTPLPMPRKRFKPRTQLERRPKRKKAFKEKNKSRTDFA
jgi:hypothetical protein